jgi:hypothetical protein
LIGPILMAGFLCLSSAGGSPAWGTAAQAPQSSWFVDMNLFSASAHGTLKCEECHGPMVDKDKSHPDEKSPAFMKQDPKRTFDYGMCQKCHKKGYERYQNGEHAKAIKKEKETDQVSKTGFAPTCGDCHSAHYSKSHISRVETGKAMTETCGTCHPDQRDSYLANYHGKAAVNLGHDKAAFCTDCHGAHESLSLKDNPQTLKTCQRCHPDATENFADIIIHDSPLHADKKNETKQSGLTKVHFLGFLSFLFIVLVLAFFYSHSCLLMLRKLHEKLRK